MNESHDFFSSSFDADLNLSSMDDFPFGNEMFPPVSAGHDQNVSFTLGDELAREAGGSWLDILEHPLDQLGAGNFSDGLGYTFSSDIDVRSPSSLSAVDRKMYN